MTDDDRLRQAALRLFERAGYDMKDIRLAVYEALSPEESCQTINYPRVHVMFRGTIKEWTHVIIDPARLTFYDDRGINDVSIDTGRTRVCLKIADLIGNI